MVVTFAGNSWRHIVRSNGVMAECLHTQFHTFQISFACNISDLDAIEPCLMPLREMGLRLRLVSYGVREATLNDAIVLGWLRLHDDPVARESDSKQ